jgi:protein-S-isoprenylcysteine O-methyltransferase Ste14
MKLLIPPPIQAFCCAGIMWMISSYVPELGYSFRFSNYLVGAFLISGVIIDLTAIKSFMQAKTTISPLSPNNSSSLVVSGIYKFTRNPMYVGLVLILTGFAFWVENYGAFAVVPCFVYFITNYQIIPEEEILIEKFGIPYADYCATVNRWF